MPSGKSAGSPLNTCSSAGGPPVEVPIAISSGLAVFALLSICESQRRDCTGSAVILISFGWTDGVGLTTRAGCTRALIAPRTLALISIAAAPEVNAASVGFSIKSTAPRAKART